MKAISSVLMAASVLAFTACGGTGASSGGASDPAVKDDTGNDGTGEDTEPGGDTVVPDGETTGDGESNCTVTHFTSGGESRFRVQGPGGDAAYDCIKCPGPEDVVKLTYTGAGFVQSLEFDGSLTNSANAASDELILEEVGNVCWSEDYDAGADLPSASALTVDGHAATIEFDKGPDAGGPTGTLSYYRNGALQFAIPVTEGGELLPYPDDGVQLN